MPLIEVCVQLEVEPRRCTPEVRVWLDLQPDAGLGSEVELPLHRRTASRWSGACAIPAPPRTLGRGFADQHSFTYRVGVFAHAGAAWSIVFRDRNGDLLLADSDLLGTTKAWLTGSCCMNTMRSRGSRRLPRGGGWELSEPNVVPLHYGPCLVLLDR